MTQALNEEFLRDPLQFFTGNTFEPPDKSIGHMVNWSTNIYDKRGYDPLWLDSRSTYKEVSEDSRVAHADISAAPSGTSVKLKVEQDRTIPSFPIYWLPWGSNSTRTIQLKPGDGQDHAPAIFFTATVNGCSVFVEGDVAGPTVHHLNAMNNEELHGRQFDDIDEKYDAYARVMHERWSQTRGPTAPRGQGDRPASAALHAPDYMPGRAARSEVSDQEMQQVCARLGIRPEQVEQSDIAYSGCVFGFRDDTTQAWEFWCQRQTKIKVKVAGRMPAWASMYLPTPKPFKIWPGVQGKVAMRSDYPNKNLIFIQS